MNADELSKTIEKVSAARSNLRQAKFELQNVARLLGTNFSDLDNMIDLIIEKVGKTEVNTTVKHLEKYLENL